MKRKIVLSLLALFTCSAAGTVVALLYIQGTTAALGRLVRLHQIEEMRRNLIIATQTAQAGLYTVNTAMGPSPDTVVDNVLRLEDAARRCASCHHAAPVAMRIQEVQRLSGEYEGAARSYVTATDDARRVERLRTEAAAIGSRLLEAAEGMSAAASQDLETRTIAAMGRIEEARVLLGASLLVTFLLSVAVTVHLTRSVTRPIGQLVAATREISAGNLGYALAVRDRTEFGELAAQFNAMSAALKGGHDELERQIEERIDVERQLVHDALHDALTGLPNRVLFLDRLDQLLQASRRQPDHPCAVLFLDVDRFKVINDSLGHLIGDQLLAAIGLRISGGLRSCDTVARLGGDEFGVLVSDIHGLGGAIHVAERILADLERSFLVEGNEIFVRASIGIAMRSERHEQPEQVLRDADVAMYQAKLKGRACFEVFDAEMHASVVERLRLEADLRRAVEHGEEFVLHYQPIVELATSRLTGLEALVRWRHPERGLLAAADFIPIAEESGMIVPIGEWVLERACRQLRLWREREPGFDGLVLGINISGRQFRQPDVVDRMAAVFERTGVSPRSIALEVTESTLMDNMDSCAEKLARLRTMGTAVHIDDFGTGYSSLSYLHRFPVTAVKMDRSFVARLPTHGESEELIRAVLSIAQSLRFDVVAEGIESDGQLGRLADLRCLYGQGHLLARPMAAEDLELWLAARAATSLLPPAAEPEGQA